MNMSGFYGPMASDQAERSSLHRLGALITQKIAVSASTQANYTRPATRFLPKIFPEKRISGQSWRSWAKPNFLLGLRRILFGCRALRWIAARGG
jgi:hypothetical protein